MKRTIGKQTGAKPGREQTNAELDRIAAEFDREHVADTFGPPTPDAKQRLQRAKRRRGRPRVGAGSKAISVTIEKELLARVDRMVKKRKTTRAAIISRALRAVLAAETAAQP